jgi:hypothetical protein
LRQSPEQWANENGPNDISSPPDRGAPLIGKKKRPNGAASPPRDRSPLMLAKWTTLELPPREYLLGDVLCTTSRWILNGDTA